MKNKIAILMYHNVEPDNFDDNKSPVENKPYILKKSQFQEQIEYLSVEGYKTISLKEFVRWQSTRETIPEKSIIISFDDGHISNYTQSYPILKKYGFSATFFTIVGTIGQPNSLSWEHIKEMIKNGMEIGSHTLTHPCPALLTDEKFKFELTESKRILEENLEKRINFLSSPTGYYNSAIGRIAKEAGYKAVCIGKIGLNTVNSDLFALKRIVIKRDYTLLRFKSLIEQEGWITFCQYISEYYRDILKKILGYKRYEIIRTFFLKISSK